MLVVPLSFASEEFLDLLRLVVQHDCRLVPKFVFLGLFHRLFWGCVRVSVVGWTQMVFYKHVVSTLLLSQVVRWFASTAEWSRLQAMYRPWINASNLVILCNQKRTWDEVGVISFLTWPFCARLRPLSVGIDVQFELFKRLLGREPLALAAPVFEAYSFLVILRLCFVAVGWQIIVVSWVLSVSVFGSTWLSVDQLVFEFVIEMFTLIQSDRLELFKNKFIIQS